MQPTVRELEEAAFYHSSATDAISARGWGRLQPAVREGLQTAGLNVPKEGMVSGVAALRDDDVVDEEDGGAGEEEFFTASDGGRTAFERDRIKYQKSLDRA